MNDHGVVVGYGDVATGQFHAIRWDRGGRVVDLGTLPGGTYSYANGINDRGDVVGYANTAGGDDRAVRWAADGSITDLGSLPGHASSYAYGINDKRDVVGNVPIRSKIYHAVKWQADGTASDIGTDSPLPATTAVAINNHGVVAGHTYEVSPGHYVEAVTWAAAGTTAVVLQALGGANLRSSANGINDRGAIVGYSQSGSGAPTNYPFHATLWAPGTLAPTDLGTLPGGDYSKANGVNAAGIAVGTSATGTSGEQDAVLWRRGKNGWRIVPLPQLGGGNSSEATAVDDDGDVVGEASTAAGQSVAVRWKK
ncbi:hypothetical protein [Actinomadura decatromicini]|uniref:HAF repeat-containing protein n=1 Tax=Actinomadura decatromicini TaxID=2604572 RepID=A0A5D3F8X8_9ACTN|nr:hypothetical protein [Actinomadura decatromicini]TYK43825.1 hypothetical protein FXF68_37475 [Actinomadura decatromicini]